MANYNKIILVGNLTRDPQLSYLPSQTPVVEFGLAVNHKWKGQDGQQREDVCFIDCRAYGKPAEILNQYTSKGRQILIEGRLQFDQWQDKDGNKRSKHRVFVDNFQFLDSKPSGQSGPPGAPARAPQQAPPPRQMRSPQGPSQPAPGMDEPPGPQGPAYDAPQAPAYEAPQAPAYEEDLGGGQDSIPF
jgi:single-strand DNA-binding protein